MPRVFVGIGSNQDRERNVRRAVAELERRFGQVSISTVYETRAVGFDGDPFFNLVASFETQLMVEEVADALRDIEIGCGRVRTHRRYGPRTMDIDILTYGDHIDEEGAMEIPRSEVLREAYVLRPLAELAPQVLHPRLGESYASLYARLALDETGLRESGFDPRLDDAP